ncbi:lysophospholipid acyltransferase family protein [Streptomyces sp. NPDC101115]|uniref:lysophospholipid acyltransferase family protein n=1 Tax=Streptomyces sp. NPDC101115 TaxID=3366106 RepID=UPI0038246B71
MNTAAVSPWLPTAPCTPGRCAAHPGAAAPRGGTAAGVLRLTAGLAAVLLGVLLSPLAAPLPAAGRLLLVRLWCRAVLRGFGVRIRVTGRPVPGPGPLLVVANHISWLDIPLIAAVLPGRMLAKREVRGWPVLGPLAALGGTVFIDRDRIKSLPATVGTMAAALAAGGRVTVFPEGSTWCGRARGAFRPAAFQAALDGGAGIQPLRIDYRPVGPAGFVGADTLGASLWRIATTPGLVAELRVLDPLSTAPGTDRRSLARAAEAAVALNTTTVTTRVTTTSGTTVTVTEPATTTAAASATETVKATATTTVTEPAPTTVPAPRAPADSPASPLSPPRPAPGPPWPGTARTGPSRPSTSATA